jgi:ubiquinone/menaquinone biosynthesis C-methylase UbiE
MAGVTTPASATARDRQVTALFDQLAPSYEAVGVPWFVPMARRLVDEIDLHHGDHVLDVGCGTGAALPALSEAVGTHGRVVGIDGSHNMLARAKQTVALHDLHNVELYEMDATTPDLPDSSFSAVFASAVVFFLRDPAAALRRWHDLLVPMGKLGVSTFAQAEPRWNQVNDLFTPYLPPGMKNVGPDNTNLQDDTAVERFIEIAGFQDIRTVKFDLPATFESPDHWRRWSMSVGQRAWWEKIPPNEHEALIERATPVLESVHGPGKPFTLTQTIRLTVAYRSLSLRGMPL